MTIPVLLCMLIRMIQLDLPATGINRYDDGRTGISCFTIFKVDS